MSTITDSLKNFYKKLGGSLSNLGPNSTSADIVDAMAEVYTDKEGTYVEVTEEVTEGTKIATIKTNNEDHDIYAPVELPAVTSADEGKVLSVDSNGAWIADDIPTELPAVTSADEGKVLSVDSNGDWAASDSNSFFDIEATVNITSTSATSGIVGTLDITSYANWGQACTALINSGKRGRIIGKKDQWTTWVILENYRGVDGVSFNFIMESSSTKLKYYYIWTPLSAAYTDANIRLITIQAATS